MAKNTQDVVLGMLSDVGSATRPPHEAGPSRTLSPTRDPVPATPPEEELPAVVGTEPAAAPTKAAEVPDAPRTLRLRAETASLLREAWVEAKREDVFLTAQDFASDLLDDVLLRRRRRTRTKTA